MKTNWDYTHLYSGVEAWETDYHNVEQQLVKLEQQINADTLDYNHFIAMITTQFQIEETIERYNKQMLPAVILIPSNQGTLNIGSKRISDSVEKAVGVNIL